MIMVRKSEKLQFGKNDLDLEQISYVTMYLFQFLLFWS